MQVEFDFRGILNLSPNCKGGGGGIEPCDAKISKKVPVFSPQQHCFNK